MKNCVFTIVAKNYIGVAQILGQSLKVKNPELDFFIFVADEFSEDFDLESLPSNVIIAREKLDISSERWRDMSFKYDLTEFCTAIKPSTFQFLFNDTEYVKIIYLDPDIYVFNSLDPIFEMLNSHSIVVTPHIAIIRENYIGELSESGLMSTGVFNLGFCAIKRGTAGKRLLAWWHGKLIDKCYIDQYSTYFTDQKWMDFLPCFFNNDELFIARHLGMNIAPWNFFERKITLENEVLMASIRENHEDNHEFFPVLFVHYSGYNYKELKKGTVIQNNIKTLDNYKDIELLTNAYAKAIHSNADVFDQFIEQIYTYSKFENGDGVKNFHRRIYRSLVNKGESIENPFAVGERSLHSSFQELGMTKNSSINVDKVTKESLSGVGSKLLLFNKITRLCYKVLGFERYLLLIRLLRPFSRYESQIHLFNKQYDKENITF